MHFQDFYNPFWHQTPNARQYWLYYINNIWFFNHISDWESVAYFFGKDFQPVDAVYSTHYEGNKHSWADVNKIGGSPLIYVSNGGHGSYAHSGETKFDVFTDYHRGEKETVNTFTAVDLSSTAGAGVLTFSAPWGVAGDKKAPHGPRLRVDKDQTLLDSYRARNPFKNCETYPDIEMYGTSVSLPEYGVAIVESNNRNASKEKIEALLNYGPHRWASGYTEDGSCEPVALPQPVKELELSAIDKIAVKWEGGASSKAPFGYRLSFYHDTEQDDQQSQWLCLGWKCVQTSRVALKWALKRIHRHRQHSLFASMLKHFTPVGQVMWCLPVRNRRLHWSLTIPGVWEVKST